MIKNQRKSVGQQEWPEAATPGSRLGGGRYLLKRILGHGGYTQVWLARDVRAEREVALKILPRGFPWEPQLLERLDEEIRRSALLAHPGIARVNELVCDHQVAAIATEYVDGWPLAAVRGDRPGKRFGREDITLWVHQVCAALEYAHHGFCLVHRCLQPANLLLNRREQLKVTDFGIDYAVNRLAAEHGKPGAGTDAYTSPQQIEGAEASVLDDIYALGATIFDLVTGTPPFHQGELRQQILNAQPPTMKQRLRELSADESIEPAWEETVAACLAKEPGKRPQSANDVIGGLERKGNRQSSPAPPRSLKGTRNGLAEAKNYVAGKVPKVVSKVQALLAARKSPSREKGDNTRDGLGDA
jgi:serine/threonine protein kinase